MNASTVSRNNNICAIFKYFIIRIAERFMYTSFSLYEIEVKTQAI